MKFEIPTKYKFLKVLGEGLYGKVLECEDIDSTQTVAIKIPTYKQSGVEVLVLKTLMEHNLDQRCIVKFCDSFSTQFGEAMVFETLDISLHDYVCKVQRPPVQLSHIRTIVQQVTTALDALKSIGIIHSDLKLDNIMLVDHLRQPLKLKLIDFGLAMKTSKVKQGTSLQPMEYRAPEVILGQPVSEAIDMWALGNIMFNLLFGALLYKADCEYEAMWSIVKLFGQPAAHLLNNGKKTKLYFKRTFTNSWKLKTPVEYFGSTPKMNYGDLRNILDDSKKLRLEKWNKAEAVERDQCIELLKAMLKLDPKERITPSEVLNHPFVTQSFDSNDASGSAKQKPSSRTMVCPAAAPSSPQSDSNSCFKTPGTLTFKCQPPATAMTDDYTANIQPDHRGSFHTKKPSRMIAVQRATAENTTVLDDEESSVSLETHKKNTPRSRASPSINESLNCEPPSTATTDDYTADIQPDHRGSFHTKKPSRMIAVQRATAENTTVLGDEESSVSLQSKVEVTPRDAQDSTACDEIKTKKKKKSLASRFWCWMKKTFSCVTCKIRT